MGTEQAMLVQRQKIKYVRHWIVRGTKERQEGWRRKEVSGAIAILHGASQEGFAVVTFE